MMVLQSHVLFENSPESESMSCSNLVVNQQYKFKASCWYSRTYINRLLIVSLLFTGQPTTFCLTVN